MTYGISPAELKIEDSTRQVLTKFFEAKNHINQQLLTVAKDAQIGLIDLHRMHLHMAKKEFDKVRLLVFFNRRLSTASSLLRKLLGIMDISDPGMVTDLDILSNGSSKLVKMFQAESKPTLASVQNLIGALGNTMTRIATASVKEFKDRKLPHENTNNTIVMFLNDLSALSKDVKEYLFSAKTEDDHNYFYSADNSF